MTLILGIDPGSRITGYGIIEVGLKKSHRYITSGCIRLKLPSKDVSLYENLNSIFGRLTEIMVNYSPEEMAIEQIFMHKNPGSAIKLGQARGAAIVAATQKNLPVAQYSARQIKQAVVGYGAAKKEQVQHMVCTLLKLPGVPQADAADALAVAICHANSREGLGNLLAIQGLRRGRLR